MPYYFTYSEDTYTITPPDEDGGDWSHQGDYGLNVTLHRMHASKPRGAAWGWEEVGPDSYNTPYDVEHVPVGEVAYVVVAEYTDGGTFGSNGYWCVPGVYADPERALECQRKCEGDNDSRMAFRPWDGYFAGLSGVRVEAMNVSP